jgi:hypothetical protein
MTAMGEEKYHKPKIIMQNVIKSALDVPNQLVRDCTCMRSTRYWCLKLFCSLIDVACVNAFVLWMLKYPNWQQKEDN